MKKAWSTIVNRINSGRRGRVITDQVEISIGGNDFKVPEGISAVQALWYCGMDPKRGIGCLGGVCGACTMTYKVGDEPVKTALACQTMVRKGMALNFFQVETKGSVPYVSRPWEQNAGVSQDETSLKSHFFETLPSTRRCVSCGACTAACPQEIDVMKGVKASINGEFREVSGLFLKCVMCGFCALDCESKVYPQLVGLYSRKMTSLFLVPGAAGLASRIREIESGHYETEWNRLLNLTQMEMIGECA